MMSYYSNMSVWFCWLLWALLNQSLFCQGSGRQRWLCGKPLADTLDTLCAGRGFHMGKRNGRSIGSVYGKHASDKGSSSSSNQLFDTDHPHHNYINHNINARDPQSKHQDEGIPSIADKGMSYFKQKRFELVNFLSSVGVTKPYNYTQDYLNRQAATHFRDSLSGALVTPSFRRRRRQAEALNIVEECCLQPCGIPTLLSYCAAADEPERDWPEHIVRQFFGMTTPRPTTTHRPQIIGGIRPPAQINRGPDGPPFDFFYVETENQATRSPLLVDRELQQQQQEQS